MARYETEITDNYTGEVCVVKSNDSFTLEQKVQKKMDQWEKRYLRESKRNEKESAIEDALDKTQEAQEEFEFYKNILKYTLSINDKIDWRTLKNHSKYKPLPPSQAEYLAKVPSQSWLEIFFTEKKKIRLNAIEEANKKFEEDLIKYEIMKSKFLERQRKHNLKIDEMQNCFESNDPKAIEDYIAQVLENSTYPESLNLSSDVFFIPEKRTVLIEMSIPNPDIIPKIIEYKYSPSKKEIVTKEMKKSDFSALYDTVVAQIALRTGLGPMTGAFKTS